MSFLFVFVYINFDVLRFALQVHYTATPIHLYMQCSFLSSSEYPLLDIEYTIYNWSLMAIVFRIVCFAFLTYHGYCKPFGP